MRTHGYCLTQISVKSSKTMTTTSSDQIARGSHVSLRDDVPANGKLYLCWHSTGVALAFEGGADFIRRWYNWSINTGVIGEGAQLHYYLPGYVGNLAYICVASMNDILRGLAAQFRWEIIRDREIPRLVERVDPDTEMPEVEYDEEAIAQLATARAEEFVRERIKLNDRTAIMRVEAADEVYTWRMERTGTEG